jgi:hypothetical protein
MVYRDESERLEAEADDLRQRLARARAELEEVESGTDVPARPRRGPAVWIGCLLVVAGLIVLFICAWVNLATRPGSG